MVTVEILTTNFSGETAQITFTPCSGGTIDLGTQVLPYDYLSDNYEGSYSLYFPDLTKTCTFDIPCSTAEPTPTPTAEPTPTPTAEPTPTPTAEPTPTPTAEPTPTPTAEPEPTPTPCDCYVVECQSPEGCRLLTYTNCDGFIDGDGLIMASGETISLCGSITDLDQFGLIITPNDYPCSFDGEIYSCFPPMEPTPEPEPTQTPTPTRVPPTAEPTPTPTANPIPTPTATANPIQFLEGSVCYDNKMSLHPSSSTVCTNIQGGVGLVNYYMSNCDYQTVFVNGNPSGCQVYINDGVTLVGSGYLSDGCRFWEIVDGSVTSTSAQICDGASECCTTGIYPDEPLT